MFKFRKIINKQKKNYKKEEKCYKSNKLIIKKKKNKIKIKSQNKVNIRSKNKLLIKQIIILKWENADHVLMNADQKEKNNVLLIINKQHLFIFRIFY